MDMAFVLAPCLLNPKAYVFRLAVFPQCLRPGQVPIVAQALLLGSITAATQAGVYGGVALAAGRMHGALQANAHAPRRLGRVVAVLFAATAGVTRWQGRQA